MDDDFSMTGAGADDAAEGVTDTDNVPVFTIGVSVGCNAEAGITVGGEGLVGAGAVAATAAVGVGGLTSAGARKTVSVCEAWCVTCCTG